MAGCTCIDIYCDDSIEVLREEIRTALKVHVCGECHRKIQPGEKYEYTAGKYESDFVVEKTCADCLSVRNAFFCQHWYYRMVWEHLREHIHDMQGVISSDCLTGLTPKARAEVCELIEKEL